jgi:lipid A 3-O-deacylase
VIGPPSLARETQTLVHSILREPRPAGWDHQIGFEPGILYRYRLDVALLPVQSIGGRGPFRFEGVGHVGFHVGSIENLSEIGGILRAGYGVVRSWPEQIGMPTAKQAGEDTTHHAGTVGPKPESPVENWRAYLFGSLDGRLVLSNRFLSGEGYHLEPRRFVHSYSAGIVFGHGDVEIAWTQVWLSREFRGQKYPQLFGSISVTLHP